MAITTRRTATSITISGATQQAVTRSIMGRIDQILIESSTTAQNADIVLLNYLSEEIYRNDGLLIDTIVNDIRPDLLPMGPVTIKIDNPVNESGTIDVTFIEKERES